MDIRIIGIAIGLAILAYVLFKWWRKAYRRLDLIIGLGVASSILALSIFPPLANILTDLFRLRNRLFAMLVASNLVLFALFFYLLNQVMLDRRTTGELIRALAKAEYKKTGYLKAQQPFIAIIIPAYNEERAIAGVLRQLPKRLLDYEVHPIVIVDGAVDDTVDIVRRENYLAVSHVLNRGQGDALRTGFEVAKMEGADIVVTMDADGQHRPEDLPKLLEPIIKGEADYVMGSRFLGVYEDSGGMRHLGILIFNLVINTLTGLRITDCTNGFRAIRGDKLSQLQLQEDRFSAPELIMEAHRHGLRTKEIPVTIKHRAASESKKPRGLKYPLGFLRAIVQVWLR